MRRKDIPLTGGQWVPHRGILRWQAAPPPAPIVAPLNNIRIVHEDDACPSCDALPHQTCRTRNGSRTANHAGRKPRVCRCGAPVGWKKILCQDCAVEARAATRRAHEDRRRVA